MQNLKVALIFSFDPRKGQCQVKLGQKSQVFKFKLFFQNMPFLSGFASGFQKMLFIFYIRQIEIPKNAFQIVTSSAFPVFFPIAQPK